MPVACRPKSKLIRQHNNSLNLAGRKRRGWRICFPPGKLAQTFTEQKMKIEYQPIGIIHSPFTELNGMPIQPAGAAGVEGTVQLFPKYSDGLKDLEGFSHIIILYHFHQSKGFNLHVVPFMDSIPRGVFATRAPNRPNSIGLSVIKLQKIQGNILHVKNVDVLDGTPLLDIKPYVPEFDKQTEIRIGWLEEKSGEVSKMKSDQRFR